MHSRKKITPAGDRRGGGYCLKSSESGGVLHDKAKGQRLSSKRLPKSRPRSRKPHDKSTSPPDFRLNIKLSMMPLQRTLNDSEPEPGPSGIPRPTAIDAIKSFG